MYPFEIKRQLEQIAVSKLKQTESAKEEEIQVIRK